LVTKSFLYPFQLRNEKDTFERVLSMDGFDLGIDGQVVNHDESPACPLDPFPDVFEALEV